jgi:hypothetical protein
MLPKIIITNNVFGFILNEASKNISEALQEQLNQNTILSIENILIVLPYNLKAINEVINNALYQTPTYKKVFLVNFDSCNVKNQNILLKTLEETQHKVDYYLISKTIFGILETIKSRCSIQKSENYNFLEDNLVDFTDFSSFLEHCKDKDYTFLSDLVNILIYKYPSKSINLALILNKIRENVNKLLIINDIFSIYNNN